MLQKTFKTVAARKLKDSKYRTAYSVLVEKSPTARRDFLETAQNIVRKEVADFARSKHYK